MASPAGCPLDALAEIAAQSLIVTLPDSPQGKPFIDRADTGTPASLLRAIRRRLNLTQREFGILLSPNGVSPISPSVICQLESALQAAPSPLVTRAVAATTAAQHLGEYLCSQSGSKGMDAAGALKGLGAGCIDGLQAYLDASPEITADQAQLVKEFLSIVTKRRHTTGGSRPGARGPYRKLSKLSVGVSVPAPTGAGEGGGGSASAAPPSLTTQPSADANSPRHPAGRFSPRVADGPEPTSGRSTPCSSACSTPGSSRGSSRPRSPTSTTGYESNAFSDRLSEYTSSHPGTPNGVAAGLTPTPSHGGGRGQRSSGEVSLEVLMALRRLQEENELLQRENKRLRAMVPAPPPSATHALAEVATPTVAEPTAADPMESAPTECAPTDGSSSDSEGLVVARAELSRADVGMSC